MNVFVSNMFVCLYMCFAGVIVFGSDQEVKDLMRAVGRRNSTGHFAWIGSDGWSSRTLVSDGNEAVVEGTLSVQPRANPVKGFDEYFFNLSVRNNARNPWFGGKCIFDTLPILQDHLCVCHEAINSLFEMRSITIRPVLCTKGYRYYYM